MENYEPHKYYLSYCISIGKMYKEKLSKNKQTLLSAVEESKQENIQEQQLCQSIS